MARNTYFEDEQITKKIDIKQLGRTWKYIIPHKKTLILVAVMLLIMSVTSLLPPIILKDIINDVAPTKDYGKLAAMISAMSFIALLEIVSTWIQAVAMGKMGHSVISKIREDIFYRLQQLPFDYFDNRPDGKIVVRVTEYINGLANFFSNFVMMFFIYIVKLLVVTIFMLYYSPMLTLVVFLTVVPMMFFVLLLRKTIRRLFTKLRAKNSNRAAFLVESIMGENVIKNYNRPEINEDIYSDVHRKCVNQWWQIVIRNELNGPIVETFWNLGTLVIYGISLAMILNGDSTINAGLVILFTQYMGNFQGPLQEITNIIQNLSEVSSNLEQVFDTIDYPSVIENREDAVVLEHAKGKVDFNDVTFAYEDDNNILEHFNLHVKPGETIALVGPTGAGKTTIINMLTRFYDVNAGTVMIDDIDVRDFTIHSLRKEVGVLMQDPFLFKGTIMENIRYGKPDASDEECIAAAKEIFADRFIMRLEGGYQHVLEERGGGLSAGEKQLVSFARIILKNPSVIILDEATSAIDTETEALIQQALEHIIKDKTAFLVAHRLSTIRDADRILYISDKGIAEQGTHEELMAKKGLYYALNV